MKIFYLIVLLTHINLCIAYAQWTSLNSNTIEKLNNIYFLNDSVGFVVGNGGTVLKTTDYGNNWSNIFASNNEDFYSIFALNQNIIYIGSTSFYKTTDGGITWFLESNLGSVITDIYYKNANVGFINEPWYLFKYENTYWTNVVYRSLYNLQFTSSDIGYIVGEDITGNPCNGFYKTIDGGNNWNFLLPTNCFKISTYDFVSDHTGYLVTNNKELYKTVDGSSTWSLINNSISNDSITDCVFINEFYGYFICVDGKIYKTYDGGNTWNVDFSNSDTLKTIAVTDNYIYVTGNLGITLRNHLSTGIDNLENADNNFKIFPNPASDILYVVPLVCHNNFTVNIFPSDGNLVYSKRLKNKSINISSLPNGLYLIKLVNDKEILTDKFLIQH